MVVGCKGNERRKWFETVIEKEEDEDVLFKSIRENPNHKFGEEDWTSFSHIEELARELNITSLAFKQGQQRDKKKSLKTVEDIQKEKQPLKVVVVKEEIYIVITNIEEGDVDVMNHHYDEMLAKFDEEIKFLENLLKESGNEDNIATSNGKHSPFPDSE